MYLFITIWKNCRLHQLSTRIKNHTYFIRFLMICTWEKKLPTGRKKLSALLILVARTSRPNSDLSRSPRLNSLAAYDLLSLFNYTFLFLQKSRFCLFSISPILRATIKLKDTKMNQTHKVTLFEFSDLFSRIEKPSQNEKYLCCCKH